MGRAFECRKAQKFKRWGNISKIFTKLTKEIEVAVKQGGPDVEFNSKLRLLIQTARSENMPKENIERAIKRAISREAKNYKEIVFEGKGPHGVAIIVEVQTDNNQRTIANIRSIFSKYGGNLLQNGSVDFLFDRMCVFRVKSNNDFNIEQLELDLIDFDLEEIVFDNNEIHIFADFQSFGKIQEYLEKHGYEIISFNFDRIPKEFKELTEQQKADVEKLLEKLDDDDDVKSVFHNMK